MEVGLGFIIGGVLGSIVYCVGCVVYTIYRKKHPKKAGSEYDINAGTTSEDN